MFVLAAAKPWTYWISFVLVAGAVLAILGTVVGYLIKVTSAKYPRQ
jgi:preprotein translocase subunit Sss1